jgi:hypothetical protein
VENDEIYNDELLALTRKAKEERIRRKTRQAQASRSIIEERTRPTLEMVNSSIAVDIAPILNASIDAPVMTELTNVSAVLDYAEIAFNDTLVNSANSSVGIVAVASSDSTDTTESEGTTAADDMTLDNNAVATTPGSTNQSVLSSVDALEDRVVLYLDEDVWKRVDLSTLLQLGYSETEINELQPTVIRLIATDVIFRPRTGVPVRWLLQNIDGSTRPSSSIPSVQIVPASVAASILQELQTTVQQEPSPSIPLMPNDVSTTTPANVGGTRLVGGPRTSKESVTSISSTASVNRTDAETTTRNTSLPETKAAGSSRIDSVNPSTVHKRTRTDVAQLNEFPILPTDRPSRPSPTVNPRVADRTRKSERTIGEPESRRRVYSGRPVNRSERMDDPPPSKSGVWPDLDTFRNLLRDEAGMRLRILGSDWSDAIKDESDWRLDLYKNWLWTLHNGWGTPLVESRSDRARRSQRANGPPKNIRKPRNR